MERLYNPFVRQGNPVIFMDKKSAEMTKYAANSFLATKITFMNEVANLCEEVGANVDMVRKGIGSDSRIGKRFLFPGVGYGGSCFPKDVKALAKTAQENNCDFRILQSVMDVNEDQKSILSRRIKNYFGESIANKTIGIWGLAFKPNTDDIREAPALTIINELLEAGAKIKAFDPEAMENVKALMGDKITLCDNQYDAIEGTDALAVVTEWNVFRTPDYDRIMSSLREPVVFDGRNVFDPVDMKERGFVYSSIGRP
jgi:UDPglucose 6-dehydrogenase